MRTGDGARPFAAVALMEASRCCLSGCNQLLLAGPEEVGTAVAEERSAGDAIDDQTIRIALNDVFFRDDAGLQRAVSTLAVEGRVLLKGREPALEDRARASRWTKRHRAAQARMLAPQWLSSTRDWQRTLRIHCRS